MNSRFFLLGLLLIARADAVEPVRLAAYPQKWRSFYKTNDSAVPANLRTNSAPLPVGNIVAQTKASDGAIWLGTTQGLMRLDLSAPARDQRQYLAGQRYLPDDFVEQVLSDEHAGVWVRTRT